MAFYDLKCDDCGHQFEKYVSSFLKDEDRVCPQCQSHNVTQEYKGTFGISGFGSSSSLAPGGAPAGGCGGGHGGFG